MVVAGDFKNGVTFEMEGNVMQVIEFQHVKPGKGAAFVRTKLRNVISGAVIEKTFSPTDKFENAYVERREMQYSYDDGDLYHFLDTETWEETLVSHNLVGESFKFVKEEMMCKIVSYKGNVFAVEPPTFVELAVTAGLMLNCEIIETGFFLFSSYNIDSFSILRHFKIFCVQNSPSDMIS